MCRAAAAVASVCSEAAPWGWPGLLVWGGDALPHGPVQLGAEVALGWLQHALSHQGGLC